MASTSKKSLGTGLGDEEELTERREAEMEFVRSAFHEEEAWIEEESGPSPRINRRLQLRTPDRTNGSENQSANDGMEMVLTLELVPGYPSRQPLQLSCRVSSSTKPNSHASLTDNLCKRQRPDSSSSIKVAWDASIRLVQSCRNLAEEMLGEEAVFVVLNSADEFVDDTWPKLYREQMESSRSEKGASPQPLTSTKSIVLGRRLIYSHHIISKVKRTNIRKLASELHLTGYMKIGWPGILIVEGAEVDCIAFYDEIRPWNWQYLVVRGEQQERCNSEDQVTKRRCFEAFCEVDDMSIVANHCREVGLESLFRTSMKLYDDDSLGTEPLSDHEPFGCLIHVDHMNDPKGYRKWLRKTSTEVGCSFLLIKQAYPNQDFTKRPIIVVVIVADERSTMQQFLKRWRTSRVDVDSKGKPCLERKMKILEEEPLSNVLKLGDVDWARCSSEEHVNVSHERLCELVESIGGASWRASIEAI